MPRGSGASSNPQISDNRSGWLVGIACSRACGRTRGTRVRPEDEHIAKTLRHLGKPSRLPASPQAATLDRVANPHPDTEYVARFAAPEFTTLCPITGQPDFAYLVIDYAPGKWLLESKSFKLYLGSFRNVGAFHEDCTVAIGKKLVALLKPKFLRIGGYWYPRGGIPIDVFWQTGKLPANVWLPDQGVAPYRARG
jgi:7-cyano-7-deazaguanine reductase